MPTPNRTLSRLDLTCIGINSIVGSSIFLFPGALAKELGPASVLTFGAVGLLMLSVGLCFAEASSRFDRAGGSYLYADEAFGPLGGFAIGWMSWVTAVLGWSAVANGISSYLGYFDPRLSSWTAVKTIAGVSIAVLAVLNYRGVKLGAKASNFFTAAKLGALFVFVAAALPKVELANLTPLAPHGWSGFGPACFMAYFAFQGFEQVPVPSGDAESPKEHAPFAVCASLLLAAGVYMAVQFAAVGAYPGLAGSAMPLAAAAGHVMGPWGAGFIALGAACSMTGYTSGAAIVAPRYMAALAEGGQLPSALGEPHPAFGTPHRSVLLTAAVAFAAAILLDFKQLVDFSNIVVCAQYAATCVAVPLLRRKSAAPAGAFRVPGGWTVPLLGLGATFWLGAQGGMAELTWAAAALAAGLVIRVVSRRPAALAVPA